MSTLKSKFRLFFYLQTHSLAGTALKYLLTTLFMTKKTEKYAFHYFILPNEESRLNFFTLA